MSVSWRTVSDIYVGILRTVLADLSTVAALLESRIIRFISYQDDTLTRNKTVRLTMVSPRSTTSDRNQDIAGPSGHFQQITMVTVMASNK